MSLPNCDLSSSFKSWLVSKTYSPATIRNYLSDVNAYLEFISNPLSLRDISLKKGNQQKPPFLREVPEQSEGRGFNSSTIFSPDTVSVYLKKIDKDQNYSRYLSSLSKFFQFAIDQKLISVSPLKKARQPKTQTPNDILLDYQSFLTKKHFSPVTIKNYLNDIRQFIDWQQNQIEPS